MRSQQQVMSIFPADDRYDAIGRVRFTRVGRPKDRKCVRSEGRQYDHRYHHKIVRFHAKFLRARSISCYDASVGFSDAAEAWIATFSCGEGKIKKRWFAKRRFQNPAICQCSWIARSAAPWFIDHQPKHRHCRAHLSDHYRASCQHNGHSSAATAIAIRINPQIMDVRLSSEEQS